MTKRALLTRVGLAATLAVLVALPRPLAAGHDRSDKRELIKQARAAYYSLRRSGLDSYQVNITVNWEVVLRGAGSPHSAEQNESRMRLLNGLHFGQSFDAMGKSVVTHRADIPAPNAKSQAGYDQIFGGMDQVITGFMDTYKPFMVTSPFPPADSDFVLEDFQNGYRVTYQQDEQVITMMTKTFAITEIITHAADFDSNVRPTFSTTADGYVLAEYDGDYVPKTKTGVVKLSGRIEHGMVEGLRLPRKLYLDSSMDGQPNATELTFSDYTIKRR